MKHHAVSIVAREQARLVAVPLPAELGAREIRGRTLHTLISPGTELAYNYTGTTFPSFPGYAAIFVAEECGADVQGISPGDICYCRGPHRSFQQVDRANAHRVPEGLAPDEALLARLMGVSMTTLITTTARPGDRVLVTGAGPVGYLAAQVFSLSGYEVMVVEPNASRRKQIASRGLPRIFEGIPVEDAAIAGTVALVVECSGHEQAAVDACKIVRKRGEVVLVGVPWRRQTDTFAHELLSLVFHKYVVLRSGWEWELPHYSTDFRPHSIESDIQTALRWLAEGRIPTEGLITSVKPHDAPQIYDDLFHRRAQGLFMVFDWTPSLSEGGE